MELMKSLFVNALCLIVLLISIYGNAFCQSAPPQTTIYLAEIKVLRNRLLVGKAKPITTSKGYNNQPSFTPDGKNILYVSAGKDSQTDVFKYDIDKKKTTQLTFTKESEYSPKVIPGEDYFSVVQVEKDSSQRLWKFPFKSGNPSIVIPDLKNLGYYTWFGDTMVAAFVVEKNGGNTMRCFTIGKSSGGVIGSSIGRSLERIPQKGGLAYIAKENDSTWKVMAYDQKTFRRYELLKTPAGSEDFAWTVWDDVVMAKDSKLFICRPPDEKEWSDLADFTLQGLHDITRIALSPKSDKIAFVVGRVEK